MGVHAAGTQQGLSYRLAPLQGTRAAVLTAMMSRAPAAHVEVQPLQSTIWQIGGGMAYSQMSRPSQELVDRLIPEYRNQLNEDFVASLQKEIQTLNRMPATRAVGTELEKLLQTYQRVQQGLSQNANNYEALARQFVNVIPGAAQVAGPTSWSKLNSRVYARLTGGHIYGQLGNIEIRVLPSGKTGFESPNLCPSVQNTAFRAGRGFPQSSSAGDLADVPLGPIIAYPNNNPGMQGLTGVLEAGNQTPASQARLVLKLEILNMQLQSLQTDLMWIDCNANVPTAVDVVASLVNEATNLGAGGQQAVGGAATVSDVADSAISFIADGADFVPFADSLLVMGIMQEAGFNCDKYSAAKAIIQAARKHGASHAATSSSAGPFTSHTIVPSSINYGSGVVTFSVSTGLGTQSGTAVVKLSLLPCSQDPNCLKSGNSNSNTSPPTSNAAGTFGSTGAGTNGAQSTSRVTMSATPNATTTGGQAVVFGFVQDSSGKLLADAVVELTATAGGVATSPSRLTTDANGAFSIPFDAPPTPGVVTFRATVNGSSPPVVATASLKVEEATGKQSNPRPQTNAKRPQTVAPNGSAVKGGIRKVDFNNFDYPSKYCVESGVATEKTIHVSKGSWTEGDLEQGNYGYFAVTNVAYGDLKGDGSEQAVVHTLCNTGANFSSHEILIYETSPNGPRLLAKLSDADWGAELIDFQVSKKYLDVSFPDGGSHACPDWLVTDRFQWNGARFVRVGQPTRKPYVCK